MMGQTIIMFNKTINFEEGKQILEDVCKYLGTGDNIFCSSKS